MARQQLKNNVRYLQLAKSNLKTKTEQDSTARLTERIEQLERELSKQLEHLERELKGKDITRRRSSERIYGEFDELRSRFDRQIRDMVTFLKASLHSPRSEHTSIFSQIKNILNVGGLLGKGLSALSLYSEIGEDFDPFGRDPNFEKKLKPLFDFFYYRYWRVTTHGIENLPHRGRALLVANHSGTLPWDGGMIRLAVNNDHPKARDVRFLVEDFVYYLPFLGTLMYRVGGVRASQENAERLLNADHLVAVFPEGVKGIGKHFSKRYHLQRFGRGGFIKLALKTGSPIIPVAVIGAEEIHPLIYKSSLLAKPLGIPYLPITPTLPWLGLLGLMPLPSKWSIYFGKPIDLSKYGKNILNNELQIHKLSEMVRQNIQETISDALKKRSSVWWG